MCRFLSFYVLFFLTCALLANCDDAPLTPPRGNPCEDLLTDDQLVTIPDTDAVFVEDTVISWIRENYHSIRSLTSCNYSDLQFLKPILAGRRLIQLGESGHGVAEFNAMKVRLIKFLHEQAGYDVIAFESSIFDCYYANERAGTLSSNDLIMNSIFGVWHTQEVLPLFEYIKKTQKTSRPLILAGFDVQISSYSGVRGRPDFLRDIVAHIDSSYAHEVGFFDSLFVAQHAKGFTQFETFIQSSGDLFIAIYDELVSFLDLNEDTLQTIYSNNHLAPLIARQTASSMIDYIEMVKIYYSNITLSIFIRDQGMAQNVEYLMDKVYPDKKIMSWAHNFHIRHKQEEVARDFYNGRTMGAWVAEKYRDVLYTIGLYMYRGHAAYNNREIYPVRSPGVNSIEAVLYRTRRQFSFIDMLEQQPGEGSAWMFEYREAKSWGVTRLSMIPRDQYDAILFIDTVNPPDYILWAASMAPMLAGRFAGE
jgi:erythromycin esterase